MLGILLPARSSTLIRLNIFINAVLRGLEKSPHFASSPELWQKHHALWRGGLPCAVVIAFAIASVCTGQWGAIDEYRFVISLCSWNGDGNKTLPILLVDLRMFIRQDVGADFVRVIDDVPEFIRLLFHFGQVNRAEGMIGEFFNTQQNDTANCVGSRAW